MAEDYTTEFRRDVADEAYFRTTDGFEALARRRGLPVELVWDWVEEFHPRGPRPFDVMHCWVGVFSGSQDDFWRYVGDNEGAGSPMCAVFMSPIDGEDGDIPPTFDDDMLYAELFSETRPIAEVLRDATFSTDVALKMATEAAARLSVSEANALVCAGDPSMSVPDNATFGELIYLGCFPDR